MTSHPYLLVTYFALNFMLALFLDGQMRASTDVRPSRGETAVYCAAMLTLGLPLLVLLLAWHGSRALVGWLRRDSSPGLEGHAGSETIR